MKRTGLLMAITLALTLALGGVALAAFIDGTRGDDRIIGTERGDNIRAKAGDDYVDALGGADFVFGNDGDDVLYGRGGSDELNGGDGNDRIFGGGGEDELVGSRGNDRIVAGDDKLPDEVQCGAGTDTALVSGPDHQAGSLQRSKCENIKSFNG